MVASIKIMDPVRYMEAPYRHPVARFDSPAKNVFSAAQQDAERRGGKVLVSGLILYSAAKAGDNFSTALLEALDTDLDTLNAAIDTEWAERSAWTQDQPFTVVKESFQGVADESPPGAELHLLSLLVKMLEYPDSMASRVIKRMGVEPETLARRLTSET